MVRIAIETNLMMENIKHTNEVLTSLLSCVAKLYAESQKKEKERWESGDAFNIFNTLGLKTEEVRLHSAFIGEMLNPNGSHGASFVFLKAFLEVLGIEDGYIDYDACSWNILERVIGTVTDTEGGRIDIIIEDGTHAVIIENKIYAPDQCNQLLRYHNYGEDMFPKGFKLLYLTLDGHDPSASSLGKRVFDYEPISYESEILEWLGRCSERVQKELPVRTLIMQYMDLVKQLTYKDMDTKYIEELKSLALSPENVLAVGELFRIQDEWLNGLLEKYIWRSLNIYAESRGMKFLLEEDGACIYKEEWKYYALFVKADKRTWRDLFVGVSFYNEPNRANKLFKKDFTSLNCLDHAPCEGWPYGWNYLPSPIYDWNCHTTEEIVNGQVSDWIKTKFDEMLAELEDRNLPMP